MKCLTFCKGFTFHYASTYTQEKGWGVSKQYIYIPLCFYLYTDIENQSGGGIQIYIPLCFYLYMIRRWAIHEFCSIYIPLCFYLYLSQIFNTMMSYNHLHSTMLLLIQNVNQSMLLLRVNLHSTMLLLIRMTRRWRSGRGGNLHSTMLLLIRIQMPTITSRSSIYIPLCFYLYLSEKSTRIHFEYLHSTMLLLIPNLPSYCV